MHARVLKRRTSVEFAVDRFLEAEFSDEDGNADLRFSIYVVDLANATRVCVEHWASAGLDPPRGGAAIDLEGIIDSAVAQTSGNDWFSLSARTHHEVLLGDVNELVLLATRFLADRSNRAQETTKSALKAYVSDRNANRDGEWLNFFQAHPKGPKWLALC